jgi:hypothetical protein
VNKLIMWFNHLEQKVQRGGAKAISQREHRVHRGRARR